MSHLFEPIEAITAKLSILKVIGSKIKVRKMIQKLQHEYEDEKDDDRQAMIGTLAENNFNEQKLQITFGGSQLRTN